MLIVKEIETKIEELAMKDDPENTHNFTVELANMVNQSLSLRHRIEENLEQEYEEKLRQKRVERIKALANCNRLYSTSAANIFRDDRKKKDSFRMSKIKSGEINFSELT